MMEETAKAVSIGLLCFFVIPNRPASKKNREHGASAIHGHGRRQNGGQFGCPFLQVLIHLRVILDVVQHSNPGSHSKGIPRKSARLIYGTGRRNHLHDVRTSAISADRQSATDDLTQRCQIWSNLVELLGSPTSEPKPCHHLIEYEQRSVAIADPPQALQKPPLGRYTSHIPRNRLHNHASDVIALLPEGGFHTVQIIEGQRDRCLGKTFWNSRRVRKPERGHSRTCPHEQRIHMAVVTAIELHHE